MPRTDVAKPEIEMTPRLWGCGCSSRKGKKRDDVGTALMSYENDRRQAESRTCENFGSYQEMVRATSTYVVHKGKKLSKQVIKAYKGSGGIYPLILYLISYREKNDRIHASIALPRRRVPSPAATE